MRQTPTNSLQTEKVLAAQLANISYVYSKLLHYQTQAQEAAQSHAALTERQSIPTMPEQAQRQYRQQQQSSHYSHADGYQHSLPAMLGYHRELVECIIAGQNSILFLPTGTGQAAVAAEASRQLLQQHSHKHIIYLTDRAHVLYQQAAVFSAHLGSKIGRYCSEPSWHNYASEFQQKQVLFFSASLYLSLLQQGVADLGMASMLILDGVHQAVKDPVMSSILADHCYILPREAAPKILGLVGSPGKGKHTSYERVRRGMSEVCEALQAKVVVPMADLDSLEERLHRPQIKAQCVDIARNEGNLLYLLHMYCDNLSRMLERHGFKGFGKLVPAANSASYVSFLADAHWAASARMPSPLLLQEAVATAEQAGKHGHEEAPQWALLLRHLTLCCQAYRAGQELGPSAVLGPLQEALVQLHHSLESDASLLGDITKDLLQALTDAAVFQELCSGDMNAIPGLSSNSRLTCLLSLLRSEAESATSASALSSAGQPNQATGGAQPASSPDTRSKVGQSSEEAILLSNADGTENLQSAAPSQQPTGTASLQSAAPSQQAIGSGRGSGSGSGSGIGSFAEAVRQGKENHGPPLKLPVAGDDTRETGTQGSRQKAAPIKAGSPEHQSQSTSAEMDFGDSSTANAVTADQSVEADAQSGSEESESLNSFISLDSERAADARGLAGSIHDSSLASRAIIFVAEEVTAFRIFEELGRSESLVEGFWRPAVLPVQGADLQDRLQQFKAGGINLLLVVAGNDFVAEIEPCDMIIRFDCMNTVTALGHSRDARLAPGGKFVALFDSSKQEQELEQLHKEESLVKAACQMLALGDTKLENLLLDVESPDQRDQVEAKAADILSMICLHSTGQQPTYTMEGDDSITCHVQLPAGCLDGRKVQGERRTDAASAKAGAARQAVVELRKQGQVAAYWSTAALLQQAGMEGAGEGAAAGADSVLWRCEVCGVPATSARNLEDHYKGYKHQRMLARHKAAMLSQGYQAPPSSHPAYQASPRQPPFPTPPQAVPHPAGFHSPVRAHFGGSPDRWHNGAPGAMVDMMQGHGLVASPMTPLMQQHAQFGSPYPHSVLGQHMSPAPWEHAAYPFATPPSAAGHPMLTPRQSGKSITQAGSPSSNQPYTCYICNATATSRKNYVAHLQGRAHMRQAQKAGSELARWRDPDQDPPATPSTLLTGDESSPYQCFVCGVATSSQALLDTHFQGRRHLKRALAQAASDTADLGLPQAPPADAPAARTPTTTQFFCEVCGVFATSEEQLIMHNEGKKHKRSLALQELTKGHLIQPASDAAAQLTHPADPSAAQATLSGGQKLFRAEGTSAEAAAAGFFCAVCRVALPSQEHLDYHLAGQKHQAQAQALASGNLATSGAKPGTTTAGSTTVGGPQQAAGGGGQPQAPPRTLGRPQPQLQLSPLPSPYAELARHEAPGHTSDASTMQSSPDSNSPEPSGDSSAADAGGRPKTKPGADSSAPRRGLRFDLDEPQPDDTSSDARQPAEGSLQRTAGHRVQGSPGLPPMHRAPSFKLQQQPQPGDGAQAQGQGPGQLQPGDIAQRQASQGMVLPDGITAVPVVDPDNPDVITMQFFCPACGIATTSEANLQDHLSGRKHARRVQHLAKTSTMLASASSSTLGDGLISRKSSGSVYEDFPCVRVGDYDLPSSMDLRQYLDEMQQVGDWEGDPDLPTIPDDEVAHHPRDHDAVPSLTRLSSFHRRRRSGSGSGALMDYSRAGAEEGSWAPSGDPAASQGVLHKYKGSMDARTFQQHSARVAELTDVLLAERAAAKAAQPPAKPAPASASPATSSPSHDQSQQPRPNSSEAPASVPQANGTPNQASLVRPGPSSGTAELAQSATHSTAHSAPSSSSSSSQPMPAVHGTQGGASSSSSSIGTAGTHHCTICNISTTSAVHLQTHYMGSKHQRRLAQAQEGGVDEEDPLHCPICGITATSDVHLQLHLNGRAHQRKARLASETSQASDAHTHGQAADAQNCGRASDAHMHDNLGKADQHSSEAQQLGRDSRGSSLSGSSSQAGAAADSQGTASSAAYAGASRHSEGRGSGGQGAEVKDEAAASSAASQREEAAADDLPAHGNTKLAKPEDSQSPFSPPNRRQPPPRPTPAPQQQPMRQHPHANGQTSPGYTERYNNQQQYGQQQHIQRGHIPQGMAESPVRYPQGMGRPGMGMQHGAHLPSPEGVLRGMPPQAVMPVQPGMPYLGFYPTAYYYPAQNPGIPGYVPQQWWAPPTGSLPHPPPMSNHGAMRHAQGGGPFALGVPYRPDL